MIISAKVKGSNPASLSPIGAPAARSCAVGRGGTDHKVKGSGFKFIFKTEPLLRGRVPTKRSAQNEQRAREVNAPICNYLMALTYPWLWLTALTALARGSSVIRASNSTSPYVSFLDKFLFWNLLGHSSKVFKLSQGCYVVFFRLNRYYIELSTVVLETTKSGSEHYPNDKSAHLQ